MSNAKKNKSSSIQTTVHQGNTTKMAGTSAHSTASTVLTGDSVWATEEAKLHALLPGLAAVHPDDLVNNKLPAFELVGAMRIWLARIEAFRGEMVDKLTYPPTAEMTSLPGLLEVTEHLVIGARPAVAQRNLKALNEEVLLPSRRLLRSTVETLSLSGLMSSDILAQVSEGRSPLKVSKEVIMLVGALREIWSKIDGKIAIDAAKLGTIETQAREANQIALEATAQIGPSETSATTAQTTGILDRAELLERALLLVLRRYTKIRTAVQYLRAEQGDADEIAPSPFVLRGGGRPRKSDGTAEPKPEASPDATPSTSGTTIGTHVAEDTVKPVDHAPRTAA